ncbi:MAG: PAS domain S-box protein, partial [Candidatus Dadabacteria bacterium]
NDWTLIFFVPTEKVFAPAITLRNRITSVFIGIAALAFVTIFGLSRRVSRTIQRLSEAAAEISRGNLDVTVRATSQDEIGSLAGSFNRMAQDLREQREQIFSHNMELALKIEERTAELRESEEKFRKLIESVPIGIGMGTPEGRIIDINPMVLLMFGYGSKDEFIEAPISSYYADPKEREHYLALMKRDGFVHGLETRMKRKDGTIFWVSITSLVHEDTDGSVSFITTIQDITERQKAFEALSRSEGLLKKVLETLPVGVWITDRDGRIVQVNETGRQIWAGAKYVGIEQYGEYKGWWLASGKRIEPEEWAAARAIIKGEVSLNEEIMIECFDGSNKIILNSALPIRDSAGDITGAIIVNEDITERKLAERSVARERDFSR